MSTGTAQSMVASCDVTNCTFNQQHQCTAGAITVSFVENMAHCATYTPEDSTTGVSSTDATKSANSEARQ